MKNIFIIIVLLFIFGCEKEGIGPINTEEKKELITSQNGLFITNEGTFNFGNASLSYINIDSGTVENNVFYNANNRPLGDVANSVYVYNKKLFIVVNNSNKIEVVDYETCKSLGTISNLTSPRYIEFTNNKAYVSDLYGNKIHVINPENYTVIKTINASGWTEKMVAYNGKLFVTCFGNPNLPNSQRSSKIYVIDTNTDNIIDSIQTPKEPNSIVLDKNNYLWVLCSGGYDYYENPKLIKISPESYEIINTYTFTSINTSPSNMVIDSEKENLYYLNSDIYKFNISDTAINTNAFISRQNNNFYTLFIDKSDNLWATNAVDFVQGGKVLSYTNAVLTRTYNVGIIPSFGCFVEK